MLTAASIIVVYRAAKVNVRVSNWFSFAGTRNEQYFPQGLEYEWAVMYRKDTTESNRLDVTKRSAKPRNATKETVVYCIAVRVGVLASTSTIRSQVSCWLVARGNIASPGGAREPGACAPLRSPPYTGLNLLASRETGRVRAG